MLAGQSLEQGRRPTSHEAAFYTFPGGCRTDISILRGRLGLGRRGRPMKMPSGLDSGPDRRLRSVVGKIATQKLIRSLRILGSGAHRERRIQIQGPTLRSRARIIGSRAISTGKSSLEDGLIESGRCAQSPDLPRHQTACYRSGNSPRWSAFTASPSVRRYASSPNLTT